jgi:hypothetical protein
MRPESSNALPRWQRWTIVGASWSLALSGLLWLAIHEAWGAGAGELPHPLEAWLMRWHGLSVPASLFAAGLVGAGHVQRGWQQGQQRASGLALILAGTVVVVTGYLLAYLAPESWRPGLGWGHTLAGVAALAAGLVHWRRALRRRAAPPPRSAAPARGW